MTQKKTFKHKIAVDVDGTLNSYVSGWTGAGNMPDAPNPGAMGFLRDLVDDGRFEPVIVSSRLNHDDGQPTVVNWLIRHLNAELGPKEGDRVFAELSFSRIRPPASVTLDDRAITFLGEWPSMDRMAGFQPFYKKPNHLRPDPETAFAAFDALMMRIGRLAKETGCPDGTAPLEWLEERARGITLDEVLSDPDALDAPFASYAEVEPIVVAAVPPGCRFSRAIAGGHPGWRIGSGWLCADQAYAGEWEDLGDFVQKIAQIPPFEGRFF